MLDFHVFGTVYRDWDVSIADVRGQACGFARYTPVRTIRCRSIEEIPDVFADFYPPDRRRHRQTADAVHPIRKITTVFAPFVANSVIGNGPQVVPDFSVRKLDA